MALSAYHNLGRQFVPPINFTKTASRSCKFTVQNRRLDSTHHHKLVLEVKNKLEKEHSNLPVGKNGRDDEEMILWYLKDRNFSVDKTVKKLTKSIKWRQDFGVSELTEESVKNIAATGKAYLHDSLDVFGRPVVVVVPSKHFPSIHDPIEDQKLCIFIAEKALAKLPAGQQKILLVFDLRDFGAENADLKFLSFLFDVLYYYYPSRLGQGLFVDAPFIFNTFWEIEKPLLGSYASLVRFCSIETMRKEYFTEETAPPNII